MIETKAIMSTFISYALGVAGAIQEAKEAHKECILAEWERSKNYPRKMKKRVRKELRIDWMFANYNPFE